MPALAASGCPWQLVASRQHAIAVAAVVARGLVLGVTVSDVPAWLRAGACQLSA